MKAVQMVGLGKLLAERDIPVPVAGDRDVLIRVKAAGICHTDEHYRAGDITVPSLPLTLGHEAAGIVEKAGKSVTAFRPGDRVCIHYLATCGICSYCLSGNEQFCASAEMIGKHRDVMMCSTATAFHALRKGRMKAGERVAVFGAGGLGISAVQLARLMGAVEVFAVDIRAEKLRVAQKHGAVPVDAAAVDPVVRIRELTGGRGVDVALEMAGLTVTAKQAMASLGKLGRLVLVGLCDKPFEVRAYSDMLGSEAEIIGCSDHLLSELPIVLEFARHDRLDFSDVVARTIPLEAGAVNGALQALHVYKGEVRTVIVP